MDLIIVSADTVNSSKQTDTSAKFMGFNSINSITNPLYGPEDETSIRLQFEGNKR